MKKRLIPAILILAMILSACGKTSEGSSGAVIDETPEPTPTPTPKFSYLSDIKEIADEANGLTVLSMEDGGYYAYSMEKTGEDIPQDVINAAKKKGTEVKNDGRYDVYEISLYFVDKSGQVSKLDKYTQLPNDKNERSLKEFKSVSDICGVAEYDDSTLVTIEQTYASGSSLPDNAADIDDDADYNEFYTTWYIRFLDSKTGKVKDTYEIINEDGAYFYASSMKIIEDKIYVASSSDTGNGVTAINLDGTIDKTALYNGSIIKLINLSAGDLAVYGLKNGMPVISRVMSDYTFEDAYTLDSNVSNVYSGSGEYDFFFSTQLDFLGFNKEECCDDKLFSFAGVNVSASRIVSEIVTGDNGDVFFVENEFSGNSYKNLLVSLERSGYSKSSEREVLTLYSLNPSYALSDVVAEYNKTNLDVKIEFTDSKSAADIIDLSGENFRELALKGELEDLYPYIDEDKELNRSDFFSNILVALEIDGKLYETASGFSLNTVLGPSRVVGDGTKWNYDKYYSVLSSVTADPFDIYVTRDEIFREVLSEDLDWFINWEEGYSNFDNENFAAMLEFVNTFPAQFNNEDRSGDDKKDNTDLRISGGRQLLLRTSLYSFDDACRAGFEYGEDVTFIGYPTNNGAGSAVNIATVSLGENLAMSSSSSNKIAAWAFLRTFFTGEYQKTLSYFPMRVDLFNERLKDYSLDYLLDDDGNLMYDKTTGEKLKRALGTMYLSDYTEIYYYGLDERKAEKLTSLVSTVGKISDCDERLYSIINSASKGYFDGSQTKEEAAKCVQTKVMEYLGNVPVNKE